MTATPVGSRIWVELEDQIGSKVGAIWIPDEAREGRKWKGRVGRIVAEGPQAKDILGESGIGKRVVLRGYSGQKFDLDDRNLFHCDADRVEAFVDDDASVKGGGDAPGMERCPNCGPARPELGKGNPFLILDPNETGSKRRLICERCGYSQAVK